MLVVSRRILKINRRIGSDQAAWQKTWKGRVDASHRVTLPDLVQGYLLIRNRTHLGSYSRTAPMVLW